tara:strand:- start:2024 stop:2479 length:456 start_codon:yes stop_codon:yes gene_type:complete
MKNIFLIIIFLLLNNCGYTPIYTSRDSNFKIVSINSNVNNSLTNYIENNISVFSNEESNKKYNISFELKEEISVILKDSKGDPSKNRLTISIDLSLLDINENLVASNSFSESFQYNIDDNKFNLKQYEKNIKFSLVEQISTQIIEFLTNVK